MNYEARQDRLAQQVSQMMEQGLDAQDASTRSALNAVRRRALTELDEPSLLQRMHEAVADWSLGGAMVALGLSALLLSGLPGEPSGTPGDDNSLDLAMMAEDVEFFENMEFYYWLEQEGGEREL